MMVGAEDAKAGVGQSSFSGESYLDGVGNILQLARELRPNSTILILEVVSLPGTATAIVSDEWEKEFGWKYTLSKISVIQKSLATKYDAIFVPLQNLFDQVSEPHQWTPDGFLLSYAGHALIAHEWLNFIVGAGTSNPYPTGTPPVDNGLWSPMRTLDMLENTTSAIDTKPYADGHGRHQELQFSAPFQPNNSSHNLQPPRILRPGMKILFAGDSITDGHRMHSKPHQHEDPANGLGDSYVYLIAAHLASRHPELKLHFSNKGKSGRILKTLEERLETEVIENKPDIVTILIGINDVLMHHHHTTPNYTYYPILYEDVLTRIHRALPMTTIIVCEPFALDGSFSRGDKGMVKEFLNVTMQVAHKTRSVEKQYRNSMRAHDKSDASSTAVGSIHRISSSIGKTHFLPLQYAFSRLEEQAEFKGRRKWLDDGVHPTPAGQMIIARRWLELFYSLERGGGGGGGGG
eukprot:CAMPEP_0174969106 /NCGR_PEP_ID=MMETSP0004_2-20121128/8543_1 /TAXON_ID=420556 /ORGANISM="Ochromonas sp., Strain CCMP1393" /LENGTH=462 /DNA_ID=CAMNT_0016218489 /DNA_START=134 /DNA_END=1522 /DNA_ORIENTATION=+